MTQEVNDEFNDTILQAEQNILRIAEELGRMKSAAEQLDEAGQRSQLLQDAVEKLVIEIGSLVELSGQVIDALNATEIRGLVTEMRTVLSRRIDGLRTEMLENTKPATERVGAELRGALIQRMDILERKIMSGTESAAEQVGAELRGALVQRMDSLENEIATGTKSASEQVSAEVVAANEHSMTASDEILKRLDALGLQIAEVRDLAEKSSKRKGLLL
ncbi:MAG: hypothetical protein OXC27_07600 [Caldilineaceae bacterium]|nr:hypothetical protein [Caldilineaceae bacterium]